MYINRSLDINTLLVDRSLFLLGPRQSGKSSYIREQLEPAPALTYNLLDQKLLLHILADPTILRQEIEARGLKQCIVCFDEGQLLIEERGIRFLLTGSSARKLKK